MKKRTANNTTRALKAIRLIRQEGMTWEEVANEMELSVGRIQAIVKEHYARPKNYNNLLAKARANKKAKAKAEKISAEATAKAEVEARSKKEVCILEPGYLIAQVKTGKDLSELLERYPGRVTIPFFCVGELRKLSNSFAEIYEILDLIYGRKILTMNLKGREILFVDPTNEVKDRSKGIVAAACEVIRMGFYPTIFTNSREVEALASLQDADISVERIESIF